MKKVPCSGRTYDPSAAPVAMRLPWRNLTSLTLEEATGSPRLRHADGVACGRGSIRVQALDAELMETVDQFMADAVMSCARLGPTEPAFREIGELLRGLATRPGLLTEDLLASLHGSASATILARDPAGPVLMLARFPDESPTPVHNHNSWGVLCVARGRDRYTWWRRVDGGGDTSHAELLPAEERVLNEGDLAWFGEPPHDIHSQQGIDGPAWELVFFGRDPNAQPRAYFDVDAGLVTYAAAER